MKTKIPPLLILMFGLFLAAGCGTPMVWYKSGCTPQDVEMVKAQARLAWTQMQYASPQVTIAAGNGNSANGGPNQNPIVQAVARGHYVDDCLIAQGFHKIPIKQAPPEFRETTQK